MSRFIIHDTPLLGLKILERKLVQDSRGFLARMYCAEELMDAGWNQKIAQINHTLTRARGAVRGMHFQYPPYCEMKLVSCIRGAVWDVAIDLRAGSSTFLESFSINLSVDNNYSLLIPEGFAHGFQTLTEDCELIYLHSAPYARNCEGGLHPLDPGLSIAWPLEITDISDRDARHLFLDYEFKGIA